MQKKTIDARILRAKGKVQGIRPLVSIRKVSLKIESPDLQIAPRPPVDAVLIFGLGPVHLSIVKKFLNHDTVALGQSRMRHNAMAALELVAHGYVKKEALVIPSGTATADPEIIKVVRTIKHTINNPDAFAAKLNLKNIFNQDTEKVIDKTVENPVLDQIIEKESEKIFTTSEAEIMEWLFLNSHSKVMHENGKERLTGKSTHIEIFKDNQATETLENFINTINELDKRSRRTSKILFNGSIAAVTSRYHIARSMETARYLGLENQIVPLISQEVLKHFGYESEIFQSGRDFDLAARWNEQMWTRALHQIPEYVLPVIPQIHDDERFIHTLHNLQNIYGENLFESFGLKNLSLHNAETLRTKLLAITRKNPKVRDWMKEDTQEINDSISQYAEFTQKWLKSNESFAHRFV